MHASPLTTYGIAGLAVAVGALIVVGSRRMWVAICVASLMALQFGLAASGILRQWDHTPPPMMPMMVVTIAVTIVFAFSTVGETMASTLSFAALAGAQAFRLPLELVMHHAATEGVMPPQMSYAGSNFDIVTGASAIVIAFLAARDLAPRWLLAVWNILGLLLLLNIGVIAVRSLPMIRAFGDDRMNTWIAYPPFVWLPGVLVPAALLGHLLMGRKLTM
jgi:hypothetical protein